MRTAAWKEWPSTRKTGPDAYTEHEELTMTYRVVLEQSEEGVSISCPGLPGCWSQGASEAEALENIKSAIREYLEVVDEMTAGKDVREVEVAAS